MNLTFLTKLEKRLAKYAIPHLTYLIVGGMAVAFLLIAAKPSFGEMLTLNLHEVARGQIWRLFTYLFIPPSDSHFFILFVLYWTWWVGMSLENEWGACRFNCFYALGMIGTTIAAALTGGAEGNFWINISLFLAFTTLFPNYQVLLFFFIPISVKWLGLMTGAFLFLSFLRGDWATKGAILAALSDYLLFFAAYWWKYAKEWHHQSRTSTRTVSFTPPPPATDPMEMRTCTLCGACQRDGADIRVCTCTKCGKPTLFCLEHARNH
ncbi:rhomboid family intramembrane serine protease [Pajaroellobacter abortibovis]|nr:rhomboid family intramembrane serine protease [Pajaroellobacter abortibovis]